MRNRAICLQLACIAALSLNSSISLAAMYKWVDEDGKTHYSQSPPHGDIKGETIKPPPRINPEHAQEQWEERKKLLDGYQKNRDESKEARLKEEQEKEQRKANCAQARAHAASMERPRVNAIAEDGTRTVMDEDQRLADLKKAREQVKEYCN